MRIKQKIGLLLWFIFGRTLPKSTTPVIGGVIKKIRFNIVKLIFKKTGIGVNVENLAYFGNGKDVEIGNYSGIGKRCRIPSNIVIGNHVMMAEDVLILNKNHRFDDISKPMCEQGHFENSKLTIGNDVWIGSRVIILPQVKRIGNGVIIGAGSVVTRDIEDFIIVAGNPAKLIKSRK